MTTFRDLPIRRKLLLLTLVSSATALVLVTGGVVTWDLLETTLAEYGAVVTSVESAAAAIAAIDRERPDVLLSDIGMPRENGYELIRRLRARPPERGGTIPAIAVTAYASIDDRAAALASGYQAHVSKPFDPEELAQVIASLRGESGSPS